MNENTAISIEGLGKSYRLGKVVDLSRTFREVIVGIPRAALRKITGSKTPPAAAVARGAAAHAITHATGSGADGRTENGMFWALRDIDLSIDHGEVIGIIGRNGAGKSTLLKILSRITTPTAGRILLYGRVGALLEVGTGFHPELTGRENIYLNGAILGMRKEEIDQKFDEIVAFAETEQFLDTPVKRYSSGMTVRLAFAVAAHLEPEIMIVDEVLAVGDASFQKKCLGKMQSVAAQGRTVLFVSHNMVAVQNLCARTIWLEDGHVRVDGPTAETVSEYMRMGAGSQTEQNWPDQSSAPGTDQVRLRSSRVRRQGGTPADAIVKSLPILFEVEFWNLASDASIGLRFQLLTEQGIIAFIGSTMNNPYLRERKMKPGLYRTTCVIPENLLNNGLHTINLRVLVDGHPVYIHDAINAFDLDDSDERIGGWYGKRRGAVRPLLDWNTEKIDAPSPTASQHDPKQ